MLIIPTPLSKLTECSKKEQEEKLRKIIKNNLCLSKTLNHIRSLIPYFPEDSNFIVLATLTEHIILHAYQNRGKSKDFAKKFNEAFQTVSHLIGRSDHKNAEKLIQCLKAEQIPFQQRDECELLYMKRIGRICYLFQELSQSPKFSKEYNLRQRMIDKFGFSIDALLYVITSLYMAQKDNRENFTIDYLIKNRDPLIKLPVSEEEIKKVFEELCWTREKREDFKKEYPHKLSIIRYPILPSKKDSNVKTVLFIEAFLFELPQILLNNLKGGDNNSQEFSKWFGKVLEDYIYELHRHSCNDQKIYNEEEILAGAIKNLKVLSSEKVADILIIEGDTAIIIETKSNLVVLEKYLLQKDYPLLSSQSLTNYRTFHEKRLNEAYKQILALEDKVREALPEIKQVVRIIVSWGDITGIYFNETSKKFEKDTFIMDVDKLEDMHLYVKCRRLKFKDILDIPSFNGRERIRSDLERKFGKLHFGDHFLSPHCLKWFDKLL